MYKVSVDTISKLIDTIKINSNLNNNCDKNDIKRLNKLKNTSLTNSTPCLNSTSSKTISSKCVSIQSEESRKFSYHISLQNVADDWISQAHDVKIFDKLLDNYFLELYYWVISTAMANLNEANCTFARERLDMNEIIRFPVLLNNLLKNFKVCIYFFIILSY